MALCSRCDRSMPANPKYRDRGRDKLCPTCQAWDRVVELKNSLASEDEEE